MSYRSSWFTYSLFSGQCEVSFVCTALVSCVVGILSFVYPHFTVAILVSLVPVGFFFKSTIMGS